MMHGQRNIKLAKSILNSISTAIYNYRFFILYASDILNYTKNSAQDIFHLSIFQNPNPLQMFEHPSCWYSLFQENNNYL
jgi:hypothetical protein